MRWVTTALLALSGFGSAVLALPAAAAGPWVAGRVTAEDGAISGARISLLPETSVYDRGRRLLAGTPEIEPTAVSSTDQDGRFLLRAPRVGLWRVRVEAPGRLTLERPLHPLVSDVRLPNVELIPDVGIRVAVLDSHGEPLAGVRLRAAAEEMIKALRPAAIDGWTVLERQGVTSADGTAELAAADGERLRIEALAPGYGTVAVVRGEGSVTLRLEAGSSREVMVRDPEGNPRSDALVRVGESGWPAGLTDGSGTLGLTAIANQPLVLRAVTASGARARGVISDPGAADEPIMLQLVASDTLEGSVVPTKGRLPPEAVVVWNEEDPAGAVLAGRDGRFTLKLPAWQDANLRAAAPGFVEAAAAASRGTIALLRLRPASVVTGKVLDPTGRPIEGAQVVLLPSVRNQAPAPVSAPERTITAADGAFRLERVAAGRSSLRIEAEGHLPIGAMTIDPRPPEPVHLGDLLLDAGTYLAVWLAGPGGRPVAGTTVWARALGPQGGQKVTCVTDGIGGCRLAPLSSRLPVEVEVRGEAAIVVKDVLPGNEPLLIELPGASSISGRVIDEKGRGLVGASVDARAPGAARQGDRPIHAVVTAASVSGEKGAYTLRGLPLASVDVSATLDGYLPSRRRGVDASDGDVILQLEGAAALAGRVHDVEGRPIAGARVSVSRHSGGEGAATYGFTDEDGWYEVDELSPGRTDVVARHRQWLAQRTQIDVDAGLNRLDLQLDRGAQVSGRVTDADGAVVTGARITLTPLTDSGRRREAASGDDGHFILGPVTPGRFMVKALAEGLMAGELAEALAVGPEGVSGVEIVLNRGTALTGRLLGLRENERRAARVSALGTGGVRREGWVEADGRYRIEGLAAGRWHVRAEVGDKSAVGRTNLAPNEEAGSLDLDFASGHRFRGMVLANGLPLSDVRVGLLAVGPAFMAASRTDSQGRFLLEGVPTSRVVLQITDHGRGLVYGEEIAIDADRDWSVDLSTAPVSGVVLDSQRSVPAAGTIVSLIPSSPLTAAMVPQAVTAADGRFRFPRVVGGTYRLRAVTVRGSRAEADLVVVPGSPGIEVELLVD